MMTIANGVSPLLGYVCYSCGNNGKIFVNGQIFSIFRLLPMYLIFSIVENYYIKNKSRPWERTVDGFCSLRTVWQRSHHDVPEVVFIDQLLGHDEWDVFRLIGASEKHNSNARVV